MNNYHTSVLLQETIDLLKIQKGKKYIDTTLGGGGHSFEVLKRGGIVLGLDVDQDAIDYVRKTINSQQSTVKIGKNLFLAKGNFKDIDTIAKENGFNNVAGILFDLGLSSHHLDRTDRGFSFQQDAPLDMRMDRELQVTARDLVNGLSKKELADLFFRFGEERFARRIADRIVAARQAKSIETTKALVEIIRSAVPVKNQKIHLATKVFQGLRIIVNDELNSLHEALPKALALLASKGRITVISFHSLEDRIEKNMFREWEKKFGMSVTKKPMIPSLAEITENPRSRSAKLRVFEKI